MRRIWLKLGEPVFVPSFSSCPPIAESCWKPLKGSYVQYFSQLLSLKNVRNCSKNCLVARGHFIACVQIVCGPRFPIGFTTLTMKAPDRHMSWMHYVTYLVRSFCMWPRLMIPRHG